MEKQHKFSIWYVLLGIWVVLLIQNYLGSALAIKTIPYSEFLNLVKENESQKWPSPPTRSRAR